MCSIVASLNIYCLAIDFPKCFLPGEWKLIDKCLGLALVNRFNIAQVHKCVIHWGTGTVNLELRSEDRPVSKESPLKISHEYEVTGIP